MLHGRSGHSDDEPVRENGGAGAAREPRAAPSPPSSSSHGHRDDAESSSTADGTRARRRRRNPVVAYLSCLCPPDTSNEAEQERLAMQRATFAENAGVPGNNSMAPASPQGKPRKENILMRFLKHEHYTDGSLLSLKTDIFSGITLAVAQVAPSVAFAIMGHGQPLVGLFSSFFLGIICCIFGGRPGQITAIAGAVVVLYPDLVDQHGFGAACAVSIFAGCFIALFGIFRVARLVRLLPSSLMLGFCNGLALSMVVNQIPQFKDEKGEFVVGMRAFKTAVICIISYAIMMLLPYFTTVVPSAFVAIFVGTAIEYIFSMHTVTIGDLYDLHGDFPKPRIPDLAWTDSKAISDVMVASVLTAIISAIESFMAGYKIQQLTETPTNFEREALALGAAHIVNGFFDGMSGCVVYGPCILNIECGSGTRRLSSLICAVLMVIIPVALYMVIGIIPMGALSAVLFGVSSKTADWRMLAMIFLQRISFQESVVAILVTVVTVVEDLAIGAAAGFAAALVFFMWNMSRGRVAMSPMQNSAPYSNAFEPEDDITLHGSESAVGSSANGAPSSGQQHKPLRRAHGQREGAPCEEGDRDCEMGNRASGPLEEVHPTVKPREGPPPVAIREGDTLKEGVVGGHLAAAFAAHGPSTALASTTPSTSNSTSLNRGVRPASLVKPSDADEHVFEDGAFDKSGAVNMNEIDVHVRGPAESTDADDAAHDHDTATHRTSAFPVSSSSSSSSSDEGILLHRSMARNPTSMDVNFLAIKRDPEFPEIKVLRVKMNGVLFFGSCMEFVDGMIKLLHEHHAEIFLKVTDLVLDFQHGMMPVMGFSAAEAIEDVARIFYKRGIRTHACNMDPLSWTCFERCRRYFPTVCDDNVNNVKDLCYARRIFHIKSKRAQLTETDESPLPGAVTTTTVVNSPANGGGALDEDVFLRANRSFVMTTVLPGSSGASTAASPATDGASRTRRRAHTLGNGRCDSLYSDPEEDGRDGAQADETHVIVPILPVPDANGDVPPPPQPPITHDDAVGVELSAVEEQVPFVDSVKIGFHVYRPNFGITVLVFDTVSNWVSRTEEALAAGLVPPLELGLTEKKPLNRQFCEFGRVWWDRLFNKDVPKPAQLGSLPEAPRAATVPREDRAIPRPPPREFRQIPRFPGQGYAKGERLGRKEWSMITAGVFRTVFHAEPPTEPNRFVARMKKFEVDLVDGFI